MEKYPEPYPIAQTGALGRIGAWVHFRDRPQITIRKIDGSEWVLAVKKAEWVKATVNSLLDFVMYSGDDKNSPQNQSQKPNQPGGSQKLENNHIPIAPEDQDEYVPQDMDEDEQGKEVDGYWQIEPALDGYYYGGVKSYFDPRKNLWSKQKQMVAYVAPQIDKRQRTAHVFRGKAGVGTRALPLPRGAQIDMSTWVCSGGIAMQDQNGCLYVVANQETDLSFSFYTGQSHTTLGVIPADQERIVRGRLTTETMTQIQSVNAAGGSGVQRAQAMCEYIKTIKKYNVKYQAHIHRTSTSNDYFYNLDNSPVLECYSANTLFVGIVREMGIPARLCTGHMPQSRDGKSHISNNTGHAWSEIWDGTRWVRMDATPTERDDKTVDEAEQQEQKEREKMEEMWFDPDSPEDKKLYKYYDELERSVQPYVRKLIAEIEAMLPKREEVHREEGYRSGELDSSKLIEWAVRRNQHIFDRQIIEETDPILNLYEIILIDKSSSMFQIAGLMEWTIKAAIIRAEVLGHFGVPTKIVFFDENTIEAMSWQGSVGGKLAGSRTPKKTHGAPARIIREATTEGSSTNISGVIDLAKRELDIFSQTPEGKVRKWSITFIGDGAPYGWLSGEPLRDLITSVHAEYPISAYYIGPASEAGKLQYYFGDRNTAVISDIRTLPKAMGDQFKKQLRKALQKLQYLQH